MNHNGIPRAHTERTQRQQETRLTARTASAEHLVGRNREKDANDDQRENPDITMPTDEQAGER